MIVLVGESASGKSTIENELADYFGYEKIITFTTRPQRKGEENGKDYYFVSDSEFNSLKNTNYFFEKAGYNGWQYGSPIPQKRDNKVIILTPQGLRALQRYRTKSDNKIDFKSFYIKVPRRERLIRLLNRGDNIEEAYRRNLSDLGMFSGIENEVDYTIDNKNSHDIYALCCKIDYLHNKGGDTHN